MTREVVCIRADMHNTRWYALPEDLEAFEQALRGLSDRNCKLWTVEKHERAA